MAVPFGTVGYTEFLKSKEYFRLLSLLYPKTRESKWISKRSLYQVFVGNLSLRHPMENCMYLHPAWQWKQTLLCSYMVRSRKGIEMLVNLLNITLLYNETAAIPG